MDELFILVLPDLTQDEINRLGEILYEEDEDLYKKLVNAAGEAGADLP